MSAANLSAMLFLNGLCLPDEVGTGLAVGETGQAKPDWPASADWLFSLSRVLGELLDNGFSHLISISFVKGMFFSGIACCVLILPSMNGKL